MAFVRLAEQTDISAIVELTNQVIRTSAAIVATELVSMSAWAAHFDAEGDDYPWLVVEGDQGFAGFARAVNYGRREGYAWSVELSVHIAENVRGRGYGTALYQRLIPTLQAQGYHNAFARVTRPNPASERLHLSAGFTAVGKLRKFAWKHDKWHDVGIWQRRLNTGPPRTLRKVGDAFAADSWL